MEIFVEGGGSLKFRSHHFTEDRQLISKGIMNLHEVFRDKKVLVTGHTGFKGSWLSAWLHLLGGRVVGVALDPPTAPSHFEAIGLQENILDYRVDIRDGQALTAIVLDIQPDFVFHLAAQALVRQSYEDPLETYQINVLGTLHVLEALRALKKPCVATMITSDKCYDNVEWLWGYRETDALGGPDPYSASKGAAELVIRSHLKSFFPKEGNIRIAVGRAGNVIGGGDWAANRIVPDCVRAWGAGETVVLRNPHSTRPWQHVLEPLSGYLKLAAELHHRADLHGEPFNFGPSAQQSQTVLDLVVAMSCHWSGVRWASNSGAKSGLYESGLLKLNCDKALHLLKWHASLSFDETVRMTSEWYRAYYEAPTTIWDVTSAQIREYESIAQVEVGHDSAES